MVQADGTTPPSPRNLIAQQSDQYVAWGAEFVDVNNDGLLDAWVGYGQLDIPEEAQGDFDNLGLYNPRFQPDALYIQEPNGTFTDVAADWGINRETISRGGVWADLNRDGFMDFISPAIDGPAVAYVATCDDSTWLNVQPRQADGNRFAIGARIEVIADDTETPQSRWILAGGTSASSGAPPEAHFRTWLSPTSHCTHLLARWRNLRACGCTHPSAPSNYTTIRLLEAKIQVRNETWPHCARIIADDEPTD